MLLIWIAVGCSSHYPGSVSDIDIFHDMTNVHKIAPKKMGRDNDVNDIGLHIEKCPNEWHVGADKG